MGGLKDADRRHALNIQPTGGKQIKAEKVEHHVGRDRGVGQFIEQLLDAFFSGKWKGDKNGVYVTGLGLFNKLLRATFDKVGVGYKTASTIGFTVVEITDKVVARPGHMLDAALQAGTQFRRAINSYRLCSNAGIAKQAQDHAQY